MPSTIKRSRGKSSPTFDERSALAGCGDSGSSKGGGAGGAGGGDEATGYVGLRRLGASFGAADFDLRRELLPAQFDRGTNPWLVVFFWDAHDVNVPLTRLHPELELPDIGPHREAGVALICTYEGETHLHTISAAVDDPAVHEAKQGLGIPSYLADEITLSDETGSWQGRVLLDGQVVLSMTFTPLADEPPRDTDLAPWEYIQLVPPAQGPTINLIELIPTADMIMHHSEWDRRDHGRPRHSLGWAHPGG